jgi:microcompartment protein CcmL/EutN
MVAMIEGCDAMAKAARITLVGVERIGCAVLTATVRGDVAAVRAALDAGERAVTRRGARASVLLIARPHGQLPARFPIEAGPRRDDEPSFVCYC